MPPYAPGYELLKNIGYEGGRAAWQNMPSSAAIAAGGAAAMAALAKANQYAVDAYDAYYKDRSTPIPVLRAPPKKSQRKPSYKKRYKMKSGPRVRVDGSSGKTYRMKRKRKRRRKKKRKSLYRQVKKLRGLIPKTSSKIFRDFEMICMASSGDNQHRVFDLNVWDHTYYESWIANLTKVDSSAAADYRTENTGVDMSLFFKLMLKNNSTSPCNVRYAFYLCKDDDAESVLDDILEELTDRGYSNLPSVTAKSARSSTTAAIPARLVFDATETTPGTPTQPFHVPVFGNHAVQRKWKQLTKVVGATIGPGDEAAIKYSRKKFTYKPEIRDQEPFSHMKGYSFRLIISMQGSLAHDVTNTCLVGRTGYQVDGEIQRQAVIRYANPKGLREISYVQHFPPAGDLEHADDAGADMVKDDK